MNKKRLLKHFINPCTCTDWSQDTKTFWKTIFYSNKMYKDMYNGYLKCARSMGKLDLQSIKSLIKFHDFSRLIFFKFHDFSRFFGLFSNSMIFPGLEKVFFIFQVSMIFPEAGNPASAFPQSKCFSLVTCGLQLRWIRWKPHLPGIH